jgi:predicted P-loop ATPase
MSAEQLSQGERRFLEALNKALSRDGLAPPPGLDLPRSIVSVTTLDAFESAYFSTEPPSGLAPDEYRAKQQRIGEALVNRGIVEMRSVAGVLYVWKNRVHGDDAPTGNAAPYVASAAIRDAVRGHEVEILRALQIPWNGRQSHVRCPYPDHDDKDPSWRWDTDRRRAFCTCGTASIFDVIMKKRGLDFEGAKLFAAQAIGGRDLIRQRSEGCTLAAYSAAKELPVEFLRSLGLKDTSYYGTPAVEIPYRDEMGTIVVTRYRIALDGTDKFRWHRGSKGKLVLYGLDRIANARKENAIAIVEGESDCHTLWIAGFAAVASPGAGTWNEARNAAMFDGFSTVFVVVEPDQGGTQTLRWLRKSHIRDRVKLVRLDGFKDPSALYLGNPDRFAERWRQALAAAVPWRNDDQDPGDDWRAKLQKTDTGKIIPNINNTLLVLENDPAISDRFSFNEMLRAIMLGRAIGGPSHRRRMATDIDVTETQRWLQVNGNIRVSKEIVAQAMESRAALSPYHPIREYLNSLTWDGEPRLSTWLSKYLGAEQNDYHEAIGAMFLISMVARILRPGCKADHMLVLEGSQGTLKSTTCRVLAGDEYFSDNLPDLETKDSCQHLRGKWLVEVAEMHAFDRAETARLKQYITRQEERYRPPHARFDVLEPRMCVFVGTTNKTAYLNDETGGRRFWPVRTGTINIEALRRDRDQLFAEAVALFDDGSKWWPDAKFEREHIKPQQDDRYDSDVWEDRVRDWANLSPKFTTEEMARAIGIETPKISKTDQNRIAAILENQGWKRGPRAHGGRRIWVRG